MELVFADAHELLLRKYLLRVSTLYFGLSLMKIRKLAQVYAIKPEHNIPIICAQHEWARKLFDLSSPTIINKS